MLSAALLACRYKKPWWAAFASSVIYASNATSNGFNTGSDSIGTGTKTAPYLTIDKALTVAGATAAVEVNPGTPYQESSGGTGWLLLPTTKAVVIGSDRALGQWTLQCTGAVARVILLNTSTFKVVFYNAILDGTGTSSGNILSQSNTTGGLYFNYCNFRNSSGSAIAKPTLTGNILSCINCNFESTVHFAISGSGGNYTALIMQGNIFAQDNQVYQGAAGGVVTNLTVTGNSFVQNGTGTGKGFTLSGDTVGTLVFSGNFATGTFASPLLSINNSSIITSLVANNNTGNPSAGMILNNSENIGTGEISYNKLDVIVGGSDQIVARCVPGIFNVIRNYVRVFATAQQHGIAIGNDGYITDSTNATATTTQNLGSASGNVYVDQKFTTGVAAQAVKASNLATALVTLKKTGSPTGGIVLKIYADNAGVPGTLLDTSDTTLLASSLTTSAATYGFNLPAHYFSTPSTAYHYVLQYTGSVDGTNYVVISTNATVTNGSLSTASDGTTWTNDASHACVYTIFTGSFAGTIFNFRRNKFYVQAGANTTTHGSLIGAVNLTEYSGNEVYNTAIGHLFKNTYGGVAFDNIATSTIGSQGAMYFKGSHGVKAYHNTLIAASAAGGACLISSTDSANGNNAPQATGEFKNNILVCTGTGTAYAVDAGSALIITNNCVYSVGNINTVTGQLTWVGWQGAGFDASSVNSNPNLPYLAGSVAANDYVPPHGSAAGGIGANLSATVPADFNGAAFSTAPPAGAFNLAA